MSAKNSKATELTAREKLFVAWYGVYLNARKAYIAAGYKGQPKLAYRMMMAPKIRKAVNELLAEKILSVEEIGARLSQQAQASYSQYFEEDGTVDLSRLLADGQGHLIKKLRQGKDGLEVEFYDAQTALVTLARIKGMLSSTVKLSGADGGPVRMTNIAQPADLSKLTDEELTTWYALLEKAAVTEDGGRGVVEEDDTDATRYEDYDDGEELLDAADGDSD